MERRAHVAAEPDGNIRQFTFGPGGIAVVVYMVIEDQLRVDILKVVWLA